MKEASVVEEKLQIMIKESNECHSTLLTTIDILKYVSNSTAFKGGGKEKLRTEFPILEFEVQFNLILARIPFQSVQN